MATGECNCGTVAFQSDANLTDLFVCHCSICRRATGSNGIAVVIVDNDDFQWTRGAEKITRWSKPGHDWQTSFCCICGSPVPGQNDDLRMYVPAGLISQGGDALAVAHHIWVGSKAVWDEIGDIGKQHAEAFES